MNDYLANALSLARREPQLAAAGIIAVVGALTIGGFFFFQYVLHLPPCPLCLEQRQPYYVCVPRASRTTGTVPAIRGHARHRPALNP